MLEIQLHGNLYDKTVQYAHTEETHMINNSYTGMNAWAHQAEIQSIIQKLMDCKCQNQQCPPFAFTEKPLVDGMTYEAWQALPDKQKKIKKAV